MPVLSSKLYITIFRDFKGHTNRSGKRDRKFLYPAGTSDKSDKEKMKEMKRQSLLAAEIKRQESLKYQREVADKIAMFRAMFYNRY